MTPGDGAARACAARQEDSDEDTSALVAEVNKVIDRRLVTTVFQPIVHLATGEVVGYEALTRGPAGSRVEAPLDLLRIGRRAGRLAELDWICATTAWSAALAARLHPSMTIFLNFEPETLLAPCPPSLLGAARQALDHLRVMVETKEDSLSESPARLFEALALVHDVGWGVALDDAEASPATLALLPLVHPDVLKLDMRRLRANPAHVARMADGARTYAERTGATIVAQGLEKHEDLVVAAFAGATYGQGRFFGEPASLPRGRVVPRSVFPLLPKPSVSALGSPFEAVASALSPGVTEGRFLVQQSHYIEDQVDAHGTPALLLVNFRSDSRVAGAALGRLSRVSERAAFTVAFGPAFSQVGELGARVMLGELAAGDPLGKEWLVLVLGPQYAVALVARGLGDSGPRARRRFEYVLTHDRELVLQVALSFLSHANVKAPPLVS